MDRHSFPSSTTDRRLAFQVVYDKVQRVLIGHRPIADAALHLNAIG
jgi:hypothetical protein